MYLGENIRALRFRHGLTQEQLAEALHVSPQAVSRWENAAAYPDIAMLPTIANYFRISLDALMGMEKIRKSTVLGETFRMAVLLREEGRLDAAEKVLRDAASVYPDNDGLMSELALTLTLENNAHANPEAVNEAISLSQRVLQNSTNAKVRSTTAANLCFLCLMAQKEEKARELVRALPHIWECRELLQAELSQDAAYADALRTAVQRILSLLTHKITAVPHHRRGHPDNTIAQGAAFDATWDFEADIACIARFLREG